MSRLQLIRVDDGVLCVRRPRYLSASYIVHDERGVALVDAGMEADGSDMIEGLRSLGLGVDRIRSILLTHWHNDHSSGAEALRAASGATLYCHRLEEPHLKPTAAGGWASRVARTLPEHGPLSALKAYLGQSPPRAVSACRSIEDGELVDGRFRALFTPGHTSGHLAYLYLPRRILFAGDALAVSGGRVWFMSRFLTEDRSAAYASMSKLAAEEFGILCPGHRGPLVTGVAEERARIREYLSARRPWPWIS
jgi:glyoxylase-like metal-dependent hydrolase (beta-lactamase superfamily II)